MMSSGEAPLGFCVCLQPPFSPVLGGIVHSRTSGETEDFSLGYQDYPGLSGIVHSCSSGKTDCFDPGYLEYEGLSADRSKLVEM